MILFKIFCDPKLKVFLPQELELYYYKQDYRKNYLQNCLYRLSLLVLHFMILLKYKSITHDTFLAFSCALCVECSFHVAPLLCPQCKYVSWSAVVINCSTLHRVSCTSRRKIYYYLASCDT